MSLKQGNETGERAGVRYTRNAGQDLSLGAVTLLGRRLRAHVLGGLFISAGNDSAKNT